MLYARPWRLEQAVRAKGQAALGLALLVVSPDDRAALLALVARHAGQAAELRTSVLKVRERADWPPKPPRCRSRTRPGRVARRRINPPRPRPFRMGEAICLAPTVVPET